VPFMVHKIVSLHLFFDFFVLHDFLSGFKARALFPRVVRWGLSTVIAFSGRMLFTFEVRPPAILQLMAHQ